MRNLFVNLSNIVIVGKLRYNALQTVWPHGHNPGIITPLRLMPHVLFLRAFSFKVTQQRCMKRYINDAVLTGNKSGQAYWHFQTPTTVPAGGDKALVTVM